MSMYTNQCQLVHAQVHLIQIKFCCIQQQRYEYRLIDLNMQQNFNERNDYVHIVDHSRVRVGKKTS